MKVYISNYRNHWISPYTILQKVCFWEKDKDVFYNLENIPDHPYDKWSDRLMPICEAINKFLNFIHPEIRYVKIDYWDTWNMDCTLADIILPMLKRLKATKHGAPYVDDVDVPYELKSINDTPYKGEFDIDDVLHFKRWDYVIDEMIFAFEHKIDDSWEDDFRSGVSDHISVPIAWDDDGKPTMFTMKESPYHTYKCDFEGIKKVNARMENGFRLFGKYYSGLWD